MSKVLARPTFSFLLGIYLGVKWLDPMATLWLTFRETARLLQTVSHFTFLPAIYERFLSSTSSPIPVFLIRAILGAVT